MKHRSSIAVIACLAATAGALAACGDTFVSIVAAPSASSGAGGGGGASSSTAVTSSAGSGGGGGMGGGGGTTPSYCGAIELDGSDDLVQVPDHAELDAFGPITIEAWVKPTGFPGEVHVLSHHEHNLSQGYVLLMFSGSEMQFRYQDGVTNHQTGYNAVSWPAWHHLAASYDNQTLRIFIDGVLQSSNDIGAVQAADFDGPLRIGASAYSNGFRLQGLIDEVRLSKVARYTNDFAPPTEAFTVDADTVALWHFDEPSGQQVLDATGTHHGTLGQSGANEPFDPQRVAVPCGQLPPP
jgi:hypothetical protein